MYIDILVIVKGVWYPFELKYKTRGNSDSKNELKYDDNGYEFTLKNHSAHDINCYKYLYDIKRIEDIRENIKKNSKDNIKFGSGYAIMLTNDKCYWEGPSRDCYYNDFVIKGPKIETNKNLKWSDKASEETTKQCKEPIKFVSEHEIEWKPYGEPLDKGKFENCKVSSPEDISQFNYVISEIKQN